MYPNYNKDINCAIKLVLITDSAVQLIKNFPLNGKRKANVRAISV